MKNKRKKKKTLIIITVSLVLIALCFFGALYYIASTVNNYSYIEKKWITENINNKIDIYVEKSLPIYSLNGKGVFYDFLDAFSEDTGLPINISTTDAGTSYKLSNKPTLEDNDILIYKDHYVVISKDKEILSLENLNRKKIGIITNDINNISYYLTKNEKIEYKQYTSFELILDAYTKGDIDYIIVPMLKYIDQIVKSDFDIVFHLDGLYSYYTLSVDNSKTQLTNIITKFYSRWKNKSIEKKNEYFLEIYYKAKNYTELQKESITNNDFIVGYIDNLPFEGKIRKDFTGLTDTYLRKFSEVSGVTYDYIEYENSKELNNALNEKKLDIILNYYSLGNNNYTTTRTLGSTEYVVLAHIDNNIVVNSLYSLRNMEVTMLSNMNLKYSMASKNLFEIKDYESIKTLLKYIDEKSVVIIEKEVYDYYKDSSLKDYSIRYIDSERLNNTFMLNAKNTAFNSLFDFFLSTQSINELKNETVESTINVLKNNKVINFLLNNILYILGIFSLILIVAYKIAKSVNDKTKTKREDRLLYLDTMTNLKNRNYLNDNINFWNETKVYPQTIIVIDINRLKELNDKYGHEAGDKQIKSVASALIKTQRDNSEIMRTDGDEFLIYLVGYEEKRITSYIHKLSKEIMSTLPNKDYDISIGYSMINDKLKTIDDAINDSLVMIKKSKGNK